MPKKMKGLKAIILDTAGKAGLECHNKNNDNNNKDTDARLES